MVLGAVTAIRSSGRQRLLLVAVRVGDSVRSRRQGPGWPKISTGVRLTVRAVVKLGPYTAAARVCSIASDLPLPALETRLGRPIAFPSRGQKTVSDSGRGCCRRQSVRSPGAAFH